MDTFNWITATIGMVLALGMTRLLSSGVCMFRSRHRATLHWVPLVWAFCIFFSMIDFSWDLHEASNGAIAKWDFDRALILLIFALVLFLAGGLILPQQELSAGDSLKDEFAQDGRWALTFLAVFDLLCIEYDWYQWRVSPVSWEGALNFALAMLALCAIKTSSPKLEAVATILYAVLICLYVYFSA